MQKQDKATGTTPLYDSNSIVALEGLEAIRKRPAMYIGDVGSRGLHHLIREVVDNSVDEFVGGHGKTITVTLHVDGSVSIEDQGRGMPVGINAQTGKNSLDLLMTHVHAGGKFEGSSYKKSGGLHGVGVKCVNALSEWTVVEVVRDKQKHVRRYERGNPVGALKSSAARADDGKVSGTKVTFKPDSEIFNDVAFHPDVIAQRLQELSFLNAGLKLTLVDERTGHHKDWISETGLPAMLSAFFEKEKVVGDKVFHFRGEKDGVDVEVAFRWTSRETDEAIVSFANNIRNPGGGTHVDGFRSALSRVLGPVLERCKVKDYSPSDIREGLDAVVAVKLPDSPIFEGQTKDKLASAEARTAVESFLKEQFSAFADKNPNLMAAISARVRDAAQARSAAKKARENIKAQKAKSAGSSLGTLPGKLSDCALMGKAPTESLELFLVEGDSAGGSAKQGRDKDTQAILPLKGKILNVERGGTKASSNAEVGALFTALGTDMGRMFDASRMRYGKVIIMTDADVDGSHIRCLLLTALYSLAKDLITLGCVYIAVPPLYRATYRQKDYYLKDEKELQSFLVKRGLSREDVAIQRFKGLGEMNAAQLWETTMNPENRTVLKVTMSDAQAASAIVSRLMTGDASERRSFIEEMGVLTAKEAE